MQQHPIPQNITGFEFKLIGDMTVKQFAYLAGGAVIAYLTFVSPLHPLLKFPLIGFWGIFGVSLAFLPIEGRPLDKWISNFIRAILSPSQYIFHKQSGIPEFLKSSYTSPVVAAAKIPAAKTQFQRPIRGGFRQNQTTGSEKFSSYMQSIPTTSTQLSTEDQQRLEAINKAFTIPESKTTETIAQKPPVLALETSVTIPTIQVLQQQSPTTAPMQPDPSYQKKLDEQRALEEAAGKLKTDFKEIKVDLPAPQVTNQTQYKQTAQTQPDFAQQAINVEQKLHEALTEKERLASELTMLRQKLAAEPVQTVTPTVVSPPKQTENVRIVPPQMTRDIGFAGLSQYPNIISGIVKDATGEILPNIIIEVKDEAKNPVRAFKTNKLGQFSGATPLANGKYTIELEDPKGTYHFDIIGIELKGKPIQPIEIMAHDQAANERAQLFSSLFGKKQTN